MKLNITQTTAVAKVIADLKNKERDAKIAAAKQHSRFKARVNKWTAHIKQMPPELVELFKNGRYGFSETSVADALFNSKPFGERRSWTEFKDQVTLAAMSCKDLTEMAKYFKVKEIKIS